MDELYIGVDLGTTRLKAGVVSVERKLLHLESTRTPWRSTTEGPVIDVSEIGDIAINLVNRCGMWAIERSAKVIGIGVTGMAETGALLDARGRVIAPGFAWHHSLGDAGRVQRELGAERFMVTTGHGCDLAPSIVKLDYLRRQGHKFQRGQRWLNIPEYVTWRLTGVQACEWSLSGRTGLFDLRGKCWWSDAFAFLGVESWFTPGEPIAAGTPVGAVSREVSLSLAGALVTTAGHDHPVAAAGLAESGLDELCLSLGTSEAQVRVVPPVLTQDEVLTLVRLGATVDWHPRGDRWYVLATLPTGLTLERLGRLMGYDNPEDRVQLSRRSLNLGRRGDAHITDVSLQSFSIVGITTSDTPETVWVSAVEVLLQESRRVRDSISRVLGEPAKQVMMGGWTHDPLIRQRRERMGQIPIDLESSEIGIIGAARFAMSDKTIAMSA